MEKNQVSPQEINSDLPISDLEIPSVPPPEDLQKYFQKSLPKFSDSTDFHRGSRSGGVGHALVAWSFVAALIDALILFSLSCFFLVSLSLLVKVRFLSVFSVFDGSFFQVGLFAGASLILVYMIMLRVFLGFTIGEWACGLRLGNLKQRLHRSYSLKVLARMLLLTVTGLFLLPLLSMIAGRDIQGWIVRLPLVSHRKI
ncbi:MAG: RDD family protein [Pseudobdellovibrionaceae bacterium]